MEFATNKAYHNMIRLVKLKPGLAVAALRQIDQRSGGIQLVRQWHVKWTSNLGPGSQWAKVCNEGKAELHELVASHGR